MTARIAFIDTGVLVEILAVPGLSAEPDAFKRELRERFAAGQKFVLPVATIIETGNHINQVKGANADRHAAAKRFDDLLRSAIAGRDPFVARELVWDAALLTEILAGDSTGSTFVEQAAAGHFGTGDLSILVERDRFVEQSVYSRADVEIWTNEELLGAYA